MKPLPLNLSFNKTLIKENAEILINYCNCCIPSFKAGKAFFWDGNVFFS